MATVTSPRSTIAGSAKVQSSGRSGTLTGTPSARGMAEKRVSSSSAPGAGINRSRPRSGSMPGRAGRSDTSFCSVRAASSGTTPPAATSTLAARFNRSRAFTAASSPPPTTRGGLPSKLIRMGKVRIALSSDHHPLGRRIGKTLRRKVDLKPVELRRHDDLAAEPRALVDLKCAIEHLELFGRGRQELADPLLTDPHMARSAGAGAAALGLDGNAPVSDHLPASHALHGFASARCAVAP